MKGIVFGGLLLGLSVYHSLGVFGYGTDHFAEWLVSENFSAYWAEVMSKGILAILSGAGILLYRLGYYKERYGTLVDLQEHK